MFKKYSTIFPDLILKIRTEIGFIFSILVSLETWMQFERMADASLLMLNLPREEEQSLFNMHVAFVEADGTSRQFLSHYILGAWLWTKYHIC